MKWLRAVLMILPVAACKAAVEKTPSQAAEAPAAPAEPAKGSPEWMIRNAMSGGPDLIASQAAIMTWPDSAGRAMTELRKGSNGWTCLPDMPMTPVNDPMCLDSVWVRVFDAVLNNKPFSTRVAGVGYMMQGGADASNSDPAKMVPAAGEQWNIEPPHMMLIPANTTALAGLPATPGNGPWVMFAGTQYAHVMMPVK